jgi:hypothetical protein
MMRTPLSATSTHWEGAQLVAAVAAVLQSETLAGRAGEDLAHIGAESLHFVDGYRKAGLPE